MKTDNQITVLVVDDEGIIRATLKALLEAKGCEVVTACDAFQAMQKIELLGRQFDLILSDIHMRGLSGYGLRRELLKSPETKEIPFVLMSTERPAQITLEEYGIAVFLEKPFGLNELMDAIGEMVEKTEA